MTTIPLAIMLLFATVVAGGPKELLKYVEAHLRSTVDWTMDLMK